MREEPTFERKGNFTRTKVGRTSIRRPSFQYGTQKLFPSIKDLGTGVVFGTIRAAMCSKCVTIVGVGHKTDEPGGVFPDVGSDDFAASNPVLNRQCGFSECGGINKRQRESLRF